MKDPQKLGLYQTQIQTYVGFSSFMTAVVIFFVGLLLTSYHNYDLSIRVPIAFLIISVFGFLYSALIYTGCAEEISRERDEIFRQSVFTGDVISEYLGVYLLVLSIPLIITVISDDIFLRSVAIVAALIGLAIYQHSNVSMVKRHFQTGHKIISTLSIIFGIILFTSQLYAFHFLLAAAAFLGFMLIVTYAATRKHRTV